MQKGRREDLSFEPSLHEALADPVIQAVMSRDGITRDDLLRLALVARMRLLRGVDCVVTTFPIKGTDGAAGARRLCATASPDPVAAAGNVGTRPRTRWPFSVRPHASGS